MSAAPDFAQQAAALLERAAALLDIGRHKDALPLITESLRLNPESAATYCHLARALRLGGDSRAAIGVLADAIKLEPNYEWAHRLKAYCHRDVGERQAGLGCAQQAHRLAPELWHPVFALADMLLANQRLAEAAETAARLPVLDPNNPDTFDIQGRIALERKELLRAEAHFRDAIRVDPQCAHAHNNLGTTLLEQGRVEDAVRFFDSALSVDPTGRAAQANLYVGARTLRHQAMMTNTKRLLARISPKVYQYYVHREQESFGVFFAVFLVKGLIPLAALLSASYAALSAASVPSDPGMFLWAGVIMGLAGMTAARRGWLSRYFAVSEEHAAIVSNLAAWIFSPVTLMILAGVGLKWDEERWVLYLVLMITGGAYTVRRAVKRARGVYYGYASGWYPRFMALRHRGRLWLETTASGKWLRRCAWASIHPVFLIAVSLLGMAYGDPDYGALWSVLTLVGVVAGLFRTYRFVQMRFGGKVMRLVERLLGPKVMRYLQRSFGRV